MSAFLGPIHYWLYNKIKLQEGFTDRILEVIGDRTWGDELKEELETAWGDGHLPPLGEAIDHSNIHGWLQERIRLAENRYAHLVTAIRRKEPEGFELLKQVAYAYGRNISRTHTGASGAEDGTAEKKDHMNAEQAFRLFTDTFLDGMPCDHVNRVLEQGPDQVIWQQEVCLHEEFWIRAGGSPKDYYELRGAMLEGILDKSGLSYREDGREKRICTI